MDVSHLEGRVTAMAYRKRFETELEELKPEVNVIQRASSELRESDTFKTVLKMVLALGNALNGATFRGNAAGFKLNDLSKVSFACLAEDIGFKRQKGCTY